MVKVNFGQIACCILLFCPFGVADEPKTADEAIDRYIKAVGGRDKIDAVKSLRVTGKTVLGGGMEMPVTMETKRPNKTRIEFTFSGMTGTRAYDGKTGWSIMPFAGKTDPEKMSDDEVKDMEDEADLDGPLVDYKTKGHRIELLGKEDVEGSPAYKLKITKKNGDVESRFLDAETFLPVKTVSKATRHGTEVEMEQIMSDYKPVNGLMMAHSIQTRALGAAAGAMGGQATVVLEKVEANVEIPDARFSIPEAKKPEAPAEKKAEPEKKP